MKPKSYPNSKKKPIIILFNKPYQVLCQFSPKDHKQTLKDYIKQGDVYPAGRLDYDSEGLLILTNQGRWQHILSHPRYKLSKTYWVQVEGQPSTDTLEMLRKGVILKDGPTRPALVKSIDTPQGLWPRVPPIRQRATIATQWLSITLSEGRNRQVRRMTAHIGHPTLRLIRSRIGPYHLNQLQPGQWNQVQDQFDTIYSAI